MKTELAASFALAASLLALSACDAETEAPEAQARSVSFADAVATAQAEVPEGVPYEVEFEEHEGQSVIEVELFVGSIVREVHIDPVSGAVISVEDETDGEQTPAELEQQAKLVAEAKLSIPEAAAKASEQLGGTATEVEFEVIDGALVAVVTVEVDGEARELRLDPVDGQVLPAE